MFQFDIRRVSVTATEVLHFSKYIVKSEKYAKTLSVSLDFYYLLIIEFVFV